MSADKQTANSSMTPEAIDQIVSLVVAAEILAAVLNVKTSEAIRTMLYAHKAMVEASATGDASKLMAMPSNGKVS